jgi:putative addiction module CopG family antidote
MRLEESQPVPTRNISLTPEQDAFVEKVVQAGEYQNASEAVRDALRGLQQRRREDAPKLKALRAQLKPASMPSKAASSYSSTNRS